MIHPLLTRVQSNAVLDLIRQSGLDPADFGRKLQHGSEQLDHRPTSAFFKFELGERGLDISWWPDDSPGVAQGYADNFPNALGSIERWLELVSADHHAPDLWAEVIQEQRLNNAARAAGDVVLTDEDVAQIKSGLEEIEQYVITTQPLSAEQEKQVRGRFAYLLAAAKRKIRKADWLNIFIGQVVSMITSGLVSSGTYRPLMSRAAAAFGKLFEVGQKLLE